MIYLILYIISGIASAVYILGNMCLSDLNKFDLLYPTKGDWVKRESGNGETIFTFVSSLVLGPLNVALYHLFYKPVTWKWTNPWSVK